MKKRAWVWVSLVTVLLTGCGGTMKAQRSTSAYAGEASTRSSSGASADAPSAQEASMSASAPADFDGASPAPAPMQAGPSPGGSQAQQARVLPESVSPAAPRADSGASTTPAPRRERAPETRPGLGTEWGETRVSRVHDVAFERSDADRPFAAMAIHYNDRRGVEALATLHEGRRGRFESVPAAGGAVTVSIRDDRGEPLESMRVADRTFVVGEEGARYSIVLENHTSRRIEAVATVDGLDVINGQPGSMENRGYLLMPFASVKVDGFRRSQSAVATFRFAAVRDSYAAQTGTARNVGVIGVALFTERGDHFPFVDEEDTRLRDTATPFPGSAARFARPPRRN